MNARAVELCDWLDAVSLADVAHDTHPAAGDLIDRLGRHIPAGGLVHGGGGPEDEMMRPLDFAPAPDRPMRALFTPQTIADELQRLADQPDDGVWPVEFTSYSPAATLDWRGHLTVHALSILKRNAML